MNSKTIPQPDSSSMNAPFVPDFSNNYSMIEEEKYEGSEVRIITIQKEKDDKLYFAALGTKRLTETYTSKDDLYKEMQTFGFLQMVMVATADDVYNYFDNLKKAIQHDLENTTKLTSEDLTGYDEKIQQVTDNIAKQNQNSADLGYRHLDQMMNEEYKKGNRAFE